MWGTAGEDPSMRGSTDLCSLRLKTTITNYLYSCSGRFLSRRCCICADESPICVSGDDQGVGAGLAFALQPNNPAVYEQRVEETVHATAAPRLLQALRQRNRKDCEGEEQNLWSYGDDACLMCFFNRMKSCNICIWLKTGCRNFCDVELPVASRWCCLLVFEVTSRDRKLFMNEFLYFSVQNIRVKIMT